MFFKKKNENPLLELRKNMLSGDIQVNETIGINQVIAVIIDIGSKMGGYCLVAVSDGSCSLYFENGGGIIGAGQHKNVQYVSRILLTEANDLMDNPVLQFKTDIPKDKNFIIHILTKNGKYEFVGKTNDISEQSNSGRLFYLCSNVITQLRLLDERKNLPFSNDEILINFIKENNFLAFNNALDDLGNPNAIEGDKSALIIAAHVGNKDIIKKLKSKGADISYKDSTGLNALMVACYLGKADLIDELVNDDIINSKENTGYTPLMFACNAGQFECVKKLIALNANVNEKDNEDSTPIMFAAQHGYDSIVKYLLESGADKYMVGKHGLKAVDFAIQNKHSTTIKVLQE
jgi:hypothetical protein